MLDNLDLNIRLPELMGKDLQLETFQYLQGKMFMNQWKRLNYFEWLYLWYYCHFQPQMCDKLDSKLVQIQVNLMLHYDEGVQWCAQSFLFQRDIGCRYNLFANLDKFQIDQFLEESQKLNQSITIHEDDLNCIKENLDISSYQKLYSYLALPEMSSESFSARAPKLAKRFNLLRTSKILAAVFYILALAVVICDLFYKGKCKFLNSRGTSLLISNITIEPGKKYWHINNLWLIEKYWHLVAVSSLIAMSLVVYFYVHHFYSTRKRKPLPHKCIGPKEIKTGSPVTLSNEIEKSPTEKVERRNKNSESKCNCKANIGIRRYKEEKTSKSVASKVKKSKDTNKSISSKRICDFRSLSDLYDGL